jgi:hypothetical protein
MVRRWSAASGRVEWDHNTSCERPVFIPVVAAGDYDLLMKRYNALKQKVEDAQVVGVTKCNTCLDGRVALYKLEECCFDCRHFPNAPKEIAGGNPL